MPNNSETCLEIDLKALEHNYRYLRSKLKENTKFLGVVKAFAYGSDAIVISKKLEQLGADYLAVAYTSEGVLLRQAGIKLPILVLHAQPKNYRANIKHCLEPNIYSIRGLKAFLEVAKDLKQSGYPIHIKFNTGLNRLGFEENDIALIGKILERNTEIKVKSIFSHLAASEDHSEKEFTLKQIKLFELLAGKLCLRLGIKPFKHILNTSGILNYHQAQFDMVRSGIGLYGYGNEDKFDLKLQVVASLKTTISQIHHIGPNETVGYNRAFNSDASKIIATLPLGHADGIGRQYGHGKTSVLVHGMPAPIIGNVCMDMIMIDITNIDCKEGDEVLIFGKEHSAENFAKTANTISYELLCGISQRIKRVYLGE